MRVSAVQTHPEYLQPRAVLSCPSGYDVPRANGQDTLSSYGLNQYERGPFRLRRGDGLFLFRPGLEILHHEADGDSRRDTLHERRDLTADER
jgi:hypothetical protein